MAHFPFGQQKVLFISVKRFFFARKISFLPSYATIFQLKLDTQPVKKKRKKRKKDITITHIHIMTCSLQEELLYLPTVTKQMSRLTGNTTPPGPFYQQTWLLFPYMLFLKASTPQLQKARSALFKKQQQQKKKTPSALSSDMKTNLFLTPLASWCRQKIGGAFKCSLNLEGKMKIFLHNWLFSQKITALKVCNQEHLNTVWHLNANTHMMAAFCALTS